MNRASAGQIQIDFQPGLTEQFPALKDVVRTAIYGCGRPFKHVAADLDLSPARLSRMLADNPNDKLNFPLHLLPLAIESTGDKRPIYWLVEKFLEDSSVKRNRALDDLARILPEVQRLVASATDPGVVHELKVGQK